MIRKYHNHKLQANLWHCEEDPHNNHETPGRQSKATSSFFPIQMSDCKTRMDTKFFLAHLSMTFIMLINVKMPTIVGILTFISTINSSSEGFESIFFFSILVFMRS